MFGDIVNLGTTFDPKEKACTGLYFRCMVNQYYSLERGEYVSQTKFRKLKRMSCRGCPDCDSLEFDLGELANGEEDKGPIVHTHIDGAVYRLGITNIQTEYESGEVDGYDLEFVRYIGSG